MVGRLLPTLALFLAHRLLHGVAATHDTGCVSFAPSHWNLVGGPEFRQSPTDYIHFKTGCNSAASDGYVEGNVPTTPA